MTDKILVLVTCSNPAEASVIAASLLDRRLIACAVIGSPVQSLFAWKGERQQIAECTLTLKTRRDRFDALAAEVQRLHSYETPEIVALPVIAGSAAYLQWVDDSLAGN